jgi:predicted CoA-binding protein
MQKLDKKFIGKNLLVCGSTPKDLTHIKILTKDFSEAGIDLLFMSLNPRRDIGQKTYDSFAELPEVPDCAYILSDKDRTDEILRQVLALGVKKILFNGQECYTKENEELCGSLQIETRSGCPLLFSGVLPCRIHAFFGGYK